MDTILNQEAASSKCTHEGLHASRADCSAEWGDLARAGGVAFLLVSVFSFSISFWSHDHSAIGGETVAPASHKSEVLDNILFERSPIFGSAKNEEFLLAWKGIEVQSLLSDSTWWNINFANDFDFGESKIAIPSWIEGSSYIGILKP